jgi:hypothetical protein
MRNCFHALELHRPHDESDSGAPLIALPFTCRQCSWLFLLLGSWWLVRSLPTFFNEAAPKPVRQEPDYYLNEFFSQII